jgi:threonine dehydratase
MSAPDGTPIGLADVEAAAARIAGRVHRTPVFHSHLLDAELGCEVLAKGEHLQRVGAFKARGAFNALLSLDPATRAKGVIAVSSGNHAQAVALAASETGARSVVVMPSDSNPAKVAATRAYGAEVITEGVTAASREQVVLRLSVACTWSTRSTTSTSWPARAPPRWSCWRTSASPRWCWSRSAGAA